MVIRLKKLSKNNSLLLFGPRGVGKSRLLNEWIDAFGEEGMRFNLLEKDLYRSLVKRPGLLNEMIGQNKKVTHVLIDEIQKIPELLDEVHNLIESRGIYFAMSGSSARKLKRGGANLLAGRAQTHFLDPFMFDEFEKFDLNFSLRFGMMPKIYFPNLQNEKDIWVDEDIKQYLHSYAETYFREEIVEEQIVRKINPFREFLDLLAQMNNELVVFSKIAKQIDVDPVTVQSFFGIIEDTLLGFFLEPYSRSVRARQKQSPKFYLFDVGIKRAMEGTLNDALPVNSSQYGRAFEHFIITEIRKKNHLNNLESYKMSYLRTKDDAEIDLILEQKKRMWCIEIKSSDNVPEVDLNKFSQFCSDFPGAKFIVLCNEKFARKYKEIDVYPWQEGIKKLF
jgi:predicted AAA+ superfamily ATPase